MSSAISIVLCRVSYCTVLYLRFTHQYDTLVGFLQYRVHVVQSSVRNYICRVERTVFVMILSSSFLQNFWQQ